MFQGVYVPAAIPLTHSITAQAATLALPAASVITGRSAAAVRGLDLTQRYDPVEVCVAEADRVGPVPGMCITRTAITTAESSPWFGARLASAERTAFDALRCQSLPYAVATLDALLRADLVDRDALRCFIAGRHDNGIPIVREALGLTDPRAESVPESVVRVHLLAAGLHPVTQHPVALADGRTAYVDLGFPGQRVAVEYDGAWHALRMQLENDRSRRNALQAVGWVVITLTAQDLRGDPRLLVAKVRAMLATRTG